MVPPAVVTTLLVAVFLASPTAAQTVVGWPKSLGSFARPSVPVVAATGEVYVAGEESDTVFRIAPDGAVELVLHRESAAPAHLLERPEAMALGASGDLYVAGRDSDTVFRVGSDGSVDVVLDASGGGLAPLDFPETLVVDAAGDLWVAGTFSQTVFRVTPAGVVTLELDASGLGPASPLSVPEVARSRDDVFVLGDGHVFRALPGGGFEELLTPAGDGVQAFDRGTDVAVTPAGDVWVSDRGQRLFHVAPGGAVEHVDLGLFAPIVISVETDDSGSVWFTANEVFASTTVMHLYEWPAGAPAPVQRAGGGGFLFTNLVVAGDGTARWTQTSNSGSEWLWERDTSGFVVKLVGQLGDGQGHVVSGARPPAARPDGSIVLAGVNDTVLVAGPGPSVGLLMDASSAAPAVTGWVRDVVVGADGGIVLMTDGPDHVVRVDSPSEATLLLDTSGDGQGNTFSAADVRMAVAPDGSVYVPSRAEDTVFRVAPDGAVTVVLDGTGDGVNLLRAPVAAAVDAQGVVYVAGQVSHNVFRIHPTAGTSQIVGASGDGVHPLTNPTDLALDGAGNLFVSGRASDNVFRVTPIGVVTQVVDAAGDGLGNALDSPEHLAATWDGDVFVAARLSANVLRVRPSGFVQEVLDATGFGTGTAFGIPFGIATDIFGAVYVSSAQTDAVFRIGPDAVGLSVVLDAAGDGDANPLVGPAALAVDLSGDLYVGNSQTVPDLPALRLSQDAWWTDLGGAAPGSNGRPAMGVTGTLQPGTAMDRVLTHVPPVTPLLAWVSFSSSPFEAIGGTVHAFPPTQQILFVSDATGQADLKVSWPSGLPSGVPIYLQFVVRDFAVPDQLTLSNAVTRTTP